MRDMKMRLVPLVVMLSALAACAAEPPGQGPRFPTTVVTQPVLPVDKPSTVTLLVRGQWYIIDFEHELLVDPVSKDDFGAVTVTHKTGPLTVPAEMCPGRKPDADDPDVVTIKGPHVYIVKAKASGKVLLDVIPRLNRADKDGKPVPFVKSDLVRVTLDVDDGTGPRPRPPPGPGPAPQPPDPAPVVVTSFRVIFVYETGGPLTTAQSGAMYGKRVEEYLRTATTPEGGVAGFRRYDKDTDAAADQPTMAALWTAVKPQLTTVPCLVVEVNGKAKILPYPKDQDDCLFTLIKHRGK